LLLVGGNSLVTLTAIAQTTDATHPDPVLYLPFDPSVATIPSDQTTKWRKERYVAGKVGQAASFDGTSYAAIEASLPLGNSPRTLALWVRNDRGPVKHIVQVVTQTLRWEKSKAFGIIEAGEKWRFHDMSGGLDSSVKIDREWHHLAVTHDGKTIRFFLDGKQVAEADRKLETESRRLRIGGLGSPDNNFVGLIDELYVFDVPLTEAQIGRLMNGTGSGAATKADVARLASPVSRFIYGVNLPWFDGQHGHDLGPNPNKGKGAVWYRPQRVSECFADIHDIGFTVARIWLTEGREGIVFDDDGYIVRLDEGYLRNLDDMVRRAADEKVRLYLCLSGRWGERSVGRSALTDMRQQQAFLSHVIRPLAKRLRNNPTIFAFDVCNEIEIHLHPASDVPKVSKEVIRRYIRNCVRAIKDGDSKRLVSSGSGWGGGDGRWIKEGLYRGLGLDFYDFHDYDDIGSLPHVRDLNVDMPVIVGECGQESKRVDEKLQAQVAISYLRSAKSKGYAGCFLWFYDSGSNYLSILRKNGSKKLVVDEVSSLALGDGNKPQHDIKSALAGTKWVNSSNVAFEWTKDGRFLHAGKEREWKVIDQNRVQIVFGPGHIDTLEFNSDMTTFKQLIKGGPTSFTGRRQ